MLLLIAVRAEGVAVLFVLGETSGGSVIFSAESAGERGTAVVFHVEEL